MSGHKGLDKCFKQDWVDIGSKKKGGGHKKCGRSKQKADAKRKYPKCVPAAKARGMSKGQKASAVARKNKAEAGGRRADKKPNRAATFAKRKKASAGGLMTMDNYYRGML